MKIVIEGRSARLYANGSEQPTLIVHDPKQSIEKGSVAVWLGSGTIAYFGDLSYIVNSTHDLGRGAQPTHSVSSIP